MIRSAGRLHEKSNVAFGGAEYRRYAITSEADLREGVERLNGATGTKRWDNRPDAKADAKPQSA